MNRLTRPVAASAGLLTAVCLTAGFPTVSLDRGDSSNSAGTADVRLAGAPALSLTSLSVPEGGKAVPAGQASVIDPDSPPPVVEVPPAPPTPPPPPPPPPAPVIDPSHLLADQSVYSPSRNYELAMQGDGNLVVYTADGRPIWATGTVGGENEMIMQPDGNLVVGKNGRVAWSSGTGDQGPSTVSIQDDGNLVIYTAAGKPTWSSYAGDLVHPRVVAAPPPPRAANPAPAAPRPAAPKPPAAPSAPSAPEPEPAQEQDAPAPVEEEAPPVQEEEEQPAPVQQGPTFADLVAQAVSQLPGGGNGAVFHPYSRPEKNPWGTTSLLSCQSWISPDTPQRYLLDVVRHEYGHILQCWNYGGDQAAMLADAGGMTGIERIADAVALSLGASWVGYTGSPTDAEWQAANRLLSGQRMA